MDVSSNLVRKGLRFSYLLIYSWFPLPMKDEEPVQCILDLLQMLHLFRYALTCDRFGFYVSRISGEKQNLAKVTAQRPYELKPIIVYTCLQECSLAFGTIS